MAGDEALPRGLRLVGVLSIAFVVIWLLGIPAAGAIPAPDTNHTLTQPDGTAFEAHQWGDAFNHGWEAENGYTITEDEDGRWKYAKEESGRIVPTDRAVGKEAPPASVPKHVRGDTSSNGPQRSSASGSGEISTDSSTAPASNAPSTGTVEFPVILVNFNDTSPTYTASDFDRLLFGDDPDVATGPGSMKDYYQEVSYGQLTLSNGPGTYGWVTAEKGHDQYGTYSNDAGDLVREAVEEADEDVDFSRYDNDGDGYVDGVIVIHQGPGEEATGRPSDIWSHQWTLSSANGRSYQTDDGVTVDRYSIQPETYRGQITTMGIVAHETGHLLGMTDLYDTNGDSDGESEGIGDWGLMAGGSWNREIRQGDSPAHPTAFHKWEQGWIEPRSMPMNGSMATLKPGAENPDAIRWRDNPFGVGIGGKGEFFLAMNRQKTGFDAGLPGEGIIITHVNEQFLSNDDPDRKVVDVEAADGRGDLDAGVNQGDAGDPFPGSTGAEVFNATSTPNSLLYNGSPSGVDVSGVIVHGEEVTLNPAPVASVSNGSIDFGSVDQTESASASVTITNDGKTPLRITGTSIDGADAGAFSITRGGGPRTIPIGESHEVEITAAPSTPGSKSARLRIQHNGSAATSDVSLSTARLAPDLNVTPSATADLGEIALEDGGGVATIVVANNGTAPVNLTGTTFTGPDAESLAFAPGSPSLPRTVAPGDDVALDVRLRIDTVGPKTAHVVIAHNGSPRGTTNVTIAATGVDANAPDVEATVVADTENGTATVGPGETLNVSARVTDESGVENVTVDASALGDGTVTLTDPDADTWYDATITVEAATATEGVHALPVTAHDTAGNGATVGAAPVTVDLSTPTLTVTTPAAGAATNETWVDVTGTATDAGSSVDAVEVSVDGGAWSAATLAGGSWRYDATGLAAGDHEVAVRATDAAGNVGPSVTRAVTVDPTRPTITNLAPADGATTTDATPTISANYSDASSGIDVSSVTLWVDGEQVTGGQAVSPTGVRSAPTLSSGTHTATVAVDDEAGNAASRTWSFTVEAADDGDGDSDDDGDGDGSRDDDGGSSGSSGGGGGGGGGDGHSGVKSITTGVRGDESQVAVPGGFPLTRVGFVADEQFDASVTVEELPNALGWTPAGQTFVTGADVAFNTGDPDDVDGLRLGVERERLDALDVPVDALTIYHFDDQRNEWNSLETTVVATADREVILGAEPVGFSAYAVFVPEDASAADQTPEDVPGTAADTPAPIAEGPSGGEPTATAATTTRPTTTASARSEVDLPGFTATVAVLALAVVAALARRRRS